VRQSRVELNTADEFPVLKLRRNPRWSLARITSASGKLASRTSSGMTSIFSPATKKVRLQPDGSCALTLRPQTLPRSLSGVKSTERVGSPRNPANFHERTRSVKPVYSKAEEAFIG
jgi:hypothetical protein